MIKFEEKGAKRGDILILEHHKDALPCYFSEEDIAKILKKVQITNLKLVFLASCHSENLGFQFVAGGVSHCICIREKETILEIALIYFSEQFYYHLFIEKLTICEAFRETKNLMEKHEVSEIRAETFKFLLIRQNEESKNGFYAEQLKYSEWCSKCKCINLASYSPGCLQDINKLANRHYVKYIQGRSIEMATIINKLNTNRLVNIKGSVAVGKKSVADNLIFYY